MSVSRLRAFAVPLAAVVLAAACSSSKKKNEETPPTPAAFTTFQAASLVIGQADFTSRVESSPSAGSVGQIFGNPAFVEGGPLYLPDYANSRVLGFSAIPTTNGASADFVIGQADFTSSAPGTSADKLSGPQTVIASGSKLVVTDFGNNRVLVWNTTPTANGASNVVVGWDNIETPASGCAANRLVQPESVFVYGDKLLVADSGNHRVLIFDSIPAANGAFANLVLGQDGMDSCGPNHAIEEGQGAATSSTLNRPTGIWTDGTRLVVADTDNNRVLIWNTFPTFNGQPADLVLGQGGFDKAGPNDDAQNGTGGGEPTARTLSHPYAVESDGTQLFVGDDWNCRVLIWTTFPTASFEAAGVVLGQSTFTANAPNGGDANPSDRTLYSVAGLKLIGRQLFVADEGNYRYLVFDGQ